MTAASKITVTWHDGGREPQCDPDPRYPNGIDLDVSEGTKPTCKVEFPYPAKRCGHYVVHCQDCGLKGAITTAGRVDDPRSLTMACKGKH